MNRETGARVLAVACSLVLAGFIGHGIGYRSGVDDERAAPTPVSRCVTDDGGVWVQYDTGKGVCAHPGALGRALLGGSAITTG